MPLPVPDSLEGVVSEGKLSEGFGFDDTLESRELHLSLVDRHPRLARVFGLRFQRQLGVPGQPPLRTKGQRWEHAVPRDSHRFDPARNDLLPPIANRSRQPSRTRVSSQGFEDRPKHVLAGHTPPAESVEPGRLDAIERSELVKLRFLSGCDSARRGLQRGRAYTRNRAGNIGLLSC